MTGLPEDEYTGETIATLTVTPLLIAGLLVLTVVAFRRWRRADSSGDDIDRPLWFGGAVVATVAALGVAALTWWGMYPWRAEYHEWRAVAGTVETVDSRLAPAQDGAVQEKYVVKFDDNPHEYGVLDTRAAMVRPGDRLTITCVRRWQWSGTHGHDCNFVAHQKKESEKPS
jgi:hypothetical protein